MKFLSWSTLVTVAALTASCAQPADDVRVAIDAPASAKTDATQAEKADRWGSADDPAIFDTTLEYRLTELPAEGVVAAIPWAASYWPVYQDSINFRWAGAESQSPAEKYGAAFGVDDVADKVSKHHGIDRHSTRTECSTNDECNAEITEVCAKRDGADKGYCIPTWWGICHAWAPAAVMYPEPLRAVTRNGVQFTINDIKALITLMHDRVSSRFVSLRCNADDAQDEIEYDAYDRPTSDDINCKDTNPGTYHVLLANYLGLRGESFVEDRTFDDEVWNQPLRAFRITQQEEVDAQKANILVGVQPTGDSAVHHEGRVDKGQWMHFDAVAVDTGKTLTVQLKSKVIASESTADTEAAADAPAGDADLYVSFDSQPTAQAYACRPWANGSDETCELTVPEGAEKVFVSVNGYSDDAASFELTIIADQLAGVSDSYLFNDDAATLIYVKSEVDYVAESPSERDGNLASTIDTYTHTDHYEYLLELDTDGKIIGGEWLGASKKAHPDFLWLPTGRNAAHRPAGGAISWELVKAMLDESVAPEPNDSQETLTERHDATVAKAEWAHFGPFNTTDGAVVVTLTGDGDADLYVRKDSQPTAANYVCRPYTTGSAESCTVAGPGAVYVSVYGYAAANFSMTITYNTGTTTEEPQPEEPQPEEPQPEQPSHLNESGTVAQGQLLLFSLSVQAGQRVVVRTQAPNDIDLYLKMNQAATTNIFDGRGYTYTGNETVEITPTSAGVLHIGVHGYAASDFSLSTAAE